MMHSASLAWCRQCRLRFPEAEPSPPSACGRTPHLPRNAAAVCTRLLHGAGCARMEPCLSPSALGELVQHRLALFAETTSVSVSKLQRLFEELGSSHELEACVSRAFLEAEASWTSCVHKHEQRCEQLRARVEEALQETTALQHLLEPGVQHAVRCAPRRGCGCSLPLTLVRPWTACRLSRGALLARGHHAEVHDPGACHGPRGAGARAGGAWRLAPAQAGEARRVRGAAGVHSTAQAIRALRDTMLST